VTGTDDRGPELLSRESQGTFALYTLVPSDIFDSDRKLTDTPGIRLAWRRKPFSAVLRTSVVLVFCFFEWLASSLVWKREHGASCVFLDQGHCSLLVRVQTRT
jgi:hypothetical protein